MRKKSPLNKFDDRALLEEIRTRGFIILGNKRPICRALSALRRCDTAEAEDILKDELLCDVLAVPQDSSDQPELLRLMEIK